MKHIENLKLPPYVLDVVLQLTEQGSFTRDKAETLSSVISYFDTLVEKLTAKYERDIREDKLSRLQVWREGVKFLAKHDSDDFRGAYIVSALECIMDLPEHHALIQIGTTVFEHAQCEAHFWLFKRSEFIGKHDEVIEALQPEFKDKPQIEFIQVLNKYHPEANPAAWKKRLQRFIKKEKANKLKRDTSK